MWESNRCGVGEKWEKAEVFNVGEEGEQAACGVKTKTNHCMQISIQDYFPFLLFRQLMPLIMEVFYVRN